jgi:FAD/FMN-containing dehydrogenase/Fe-S oxidoreductase
VDPTQSKRIHDDLKGVVRGDLLFDELSCVLYSTDASLFEVLPAGVVVPRDEDDLCALVRYAGEHGLALIPRGAGTGLAGEALGAGVVVDLSVHFRSILEVGADCVRVQPGVVRRDLQQVLARQGRRFAPDPVSAECTVGGMLATNASGPRALRHGTTRDHVESLRVILDSGDPVDVGRVPRLSAAESPGRLEDIVGTTVNLLEQNAGLIQACAPRVPLNRCGYLLQDVLRPRELDLARLLVGSEGTLALFSETTLRTIPLPGGRAVVLLAFARLDAALRAARLTLASEPTVCDILDRRLLRLARGEPAVADLVPEGAEAALLVEYEADDPFTAFTRASELATRLHRSERLALLSRLARDEADCDRFLHLAQAGWAGLYPLRGAAQPLPIIEDVAVPPDALADFLPRLQDVLRKQETTAAFLIHTGTGQVHVRPFLDLQNPSDAGKLWALADEVYALTWQQGGTISAQNGTGLARLPWAGRQHGPLAPVFRELKAIFDPRYLFNPGKIIGPPDQAPTWPLRRRGLRSQESGVRNHESDDPSLTPDPCLLTPNAGQESLACNGCGVCRSTVSSLRACPIFRATGAEAATPRAKANLMRHLLQPDTDPAALSSDATRAVADLCVNCKMCAIECPAHIQVPRLMLQARAANVAQYGLDKTDWVLARTESFAHLGSAIAPIANALLAHPVPRWLLENFFGVSRKRRLPMFAACNFLRLARKRGWTHRPRSARPRVAYFVDTFANYNDPLIAEAVVAVLHHNGIEVYVPPEQIGSGMAPLAYGDVETAREAVQLNVRILAELAREGFPILCSEPTAALMLRHDALDLVDDADTRAVAAAVVEFTAFVWDLHLQGLLRTDFRPLEVSVGHHIPCHLKALCRPAVGPALLALIPGLRVGTIDVSCSGMAGTFGLRTEGYNLSMAAGRPMLDELSRPAHEFGSTECSACRLQMEDGTLKRTLHPAQYLALAYGLLPGVARRLREPIGEWVLQ